MELRKAQNLSQGDLAQSLGVTRQAVSKWEQDRSSPDTLNLIKLAEVLSTEVEYLATGRKPAQPAQEEPPIVFKVDKVVEKVVEKPVIRKVVRIKYLHNPIEFLVLGILCFLLGLAVGFFL